MLEPVVQRDFQGKERDAPSGVVLRGSANPYGEANLEREMRKKIVNIRLRPDQGERINAIVERSAILDTSKFVRIAVDWLVRSDIGEVIKTIVAEKAAYPDYRIPKKPTGKKSGDGSRRAGLP